MYTFYKILLNIQAMYAYKGGKMEVQALQNFIGISAF